MSTGDQNYSSTGDYTQKWTTTTGETSNQIQLQPGVSDFYYYHNWTDWNHWNGGTIQIAPPTTPLPKEYLEQFKRDLMNKLDENKLKENEMQVYEVTVVDKKECEILLEQKVIARDETTAMLDLELTPEMRKKVKKGEVEFIFKTIGSFHKISRKLRVKDIEEEEED